MVLCNLAPSICSKAASIFAWKKKIARLPKVGIYSNGSTRRATQIPDGVQNRHVVDLEKVINYGSSF